jgi:hypothetical protein
MLKIMVTIKFSFNLTVANKRGGGVWQISMQISGPYDA